MKKVRFRWVVLGALAATMSCRAPSPDWNGTWKLNPTESSYKGQVLTISISGDVEYRFDEYSSHTIRCDGKDRSIGNNRTLDCVKAGVRVLNMTLKEEGVRTRTTRDELSSDGKVFTTTVTEFRPTGTIVASRIIFSRLSGPNGFAGQWRDTSYLQQHADMILRLDGQTLHIGYPRADQYIDAPLDGVDAVVRGLHGSERTTYSARSAGRHEIRTLTKRDGKILTRGSFELSNDGRTVIDSWWNPDRPADKGTLVYDKK